MKIVWDEPKRLSNIDKHGLDFADLTVAFFEAAAIYPARWGRSFAFGHFGDQVLTVVFAPLGTEAISVVSMRPASPKERKLA